MKKKIVGNIVTFDFNHNYETNVFFLNFSRIQIFILYFLIIALYLLCSNILIEDQNFNTAIFDNNCWFEISLIITVLFLYFILNKLKPGHISELKNYHNILLTILSCFLISQLAIIANLKFSNSVNFFYYSFGFIILVTLFTVSFKILFLIHTVSFIFYIFPVLVFNNSAFWQFNVIGANSIFFFAILLSKYLNLYRKSEFIRQKELFNQTQELKDEVEKTKISDQEIQKTKDELEVKVNERTKELANAYYELVMKLNESQEKEEKIRESLKEKEIMLQEIYHRVNNNLQIVLSMFRMQQRRIQNEDVLNELRSSENRIKSMSLIHQALYNSNDLSKVNFSDYLKSQIRHLFNVYEIKSSDIITTVNCADVFLDVSTAIPCGFIANELISNSLKYAFPDDKGKITISLDEEPDNNFVLIVEDNGVGVPEGVDFKNSETLGFLLVQTLSKQIHGNTELIRNDGTIIKVNFVNKSGKYHNIKY